MEVRQGVDDMTGFKEGKDEREMRVHTCGGKVGPNENQRGFVFFF